MSQAILFQKFEGAAIFVVATYGYFQLNLSWLLYVLLILAADVGMAGYLFNPRVGALTYNFFHSFIAPSLLLMAGLALFNELTIGLACIWFAHIGIDRALGYGLKFSDSFQHTHLGKIGKKA